MKNFLKLCLTIFICLGMTNILYAQNGNQYELKSGKIEYEIKKFKRDVDSRVTAEGNLERVETTTPYVYEISTYYWDNYGDIAFEEVYQVAEFGGKILPKKIKKHEILYKENDRFRFTPSNSKISESYNSKRKKCFENPEPVKEKGCLKVWYKGAKVVGEESVASKKVEILRYGKDSDYYSWKGLILRELYFSTSHGERFELEKDKVAIKVETDIKMDPSIFTPAWLNK